MKFVDLEMCESCIFEKQKNYEFLKTWQNSVGSQA